MSSLNNLTNKEITKWIRPWNIEKFDDLTTRDERFFAIIYKGLIRWLNTHILMYDKPIKHFIYHTGSTYMYMENNGYEFSLSEITGEDTMYMQLPRCIIEMGNITIEAGDLSNPYVRGTYERMNDNKEISGYNAEIKRLPIQIAVTLRYFCGTFNESIILLEELINNFIFTQYFNVTYLGNILQCSIEYPGDYAIGLNTVDMASPEPNQKIIEIQLTISTNYPAIDERTEQLNNKIISSFNSNINIVDKQDTIQDNSSVNI